MPSLREHAVKPGGIEIALLLMAALWYASFAALFFSGKNGLDEIPWPWLLILAFGPALSAVLAFAMHLALRRYRRPLAVHEMILVVFVTPQFLGAVYVWLGLFHYMGLLWYHHAKVQRDASANAGRRPRFRSSATGPAWLRSPFGNIMTLPEDMLATANRESNEEAWRLADFPAVLERASFHRLVCVGGQFQFRGPIGTAEMYWLNADSTPRRQGEDWDSYVDRANSEVLSVFTRVVEQTDFRAEARQWKHITEAIERGTISDPTQHLYFVAYFNRNPEIAEQTGCTERRDRVSGDNRTSLAQRR